MSATETCVGCGAEVRRIAGPVHRYMSSAPGCWAMFGEINAHMYSPEAAPARWQLCVDAFAAQHPGTPSPQAIQSVAIHLLSLFAQLELQLSGPEAHGVLVRAAAAKSRFWWLQPPSFSGCRTVGHVFRQLQSPAYAIEEWAGDVWTAWTPHHGQVVKWHAELG